MASPRSVIQLSRWTGRFPQISGLRVTFACNGTTPVVTGMWKTARHGTDVPIGPADTVRFVTNDFMYTGGDGYTVFAQGTERPAAWR